MKKQLLKILSKKLKKIKKENEDLKRQNENLNQALIGALNKIDNLVNLMEKNIWNLSCVKLQKQ